MSEVLVKVLLEECLVVRHDEDVLYARLQSTGRSVSELRFDLCLVFLRRKNLCLGCKPRCQGSEACIDVLVSVTHGEPIIIIEEEEDSRDDDEPHHQKQQQGGKKRVAVLTL